MSRAVYIGGFGNGKALAKRVSEALVTGGLYEDADHLTFSEAMRDPERVAKLTEGIDVVTHSAGLIAARGAKPKSIRAVGAPLPTTIPHLLHGTGKKSLRMAANLLTEPKEFMNVGRYNASSVGELAAHPIANLGQLRNIAGTSAIEMAAAARETGIPLSLFYNEHDDYYRLSNEHHTLANSLGVELNLITGQHDQLPLYPAQTLKEIYKV